MLRTRTDYIVWHTTATPEGRPITLAQIAAMHKARGFSDIGYNEVCLLDGDIVAGRKGGINAVGAHVAGFNSRAFGISYVGGVDAKNRAKDTRTPEQIEAMTRRARELTKIYPGAIHVGHRDLSPDRNHDGIITPDEWMKECPCFDVAKWLGPFGLPVLTGKKKIIVASADLDDVAFVADSAVG